MSRRKFLKEMSMMTRKGVYPSLNILLEDEEKKDDPMGGDDPFGDDSEDSSDSDSSDDSSDDSSEENNAIGDEEGLKDLPDDSGMSDLEAKDIDVSTTVKNIKDAIRTIEDKPDVNIYRNEFVPGSSIVENEVYNLKNFVLLREESEDLEKSLEDIEKILDDEDNQEKIQRVRKKAADIQTGDENFARKIPDLVKKTIANIKNFDSLYDIASIAAGDMFDKIQNQSVPKDLRKNIEEFVYQLAQELDKQGISHALNVSATIKPTNSRNAQGGFNRG